VTRPTTGTQAITYTFTVSGGAPDATGIQLVGFNGAAVNPTALSTLGGYWSGNTFVFPWHVDATTLPGAYQYQVHDTGGRTAQATITVR
jgi:hypothetical protein